MVALIEGVAKLFPVNNAVPPEATSYHFTVPVELVAASVTEPTPHLEAGVLVSIVGELTVIVNVFEYPGDPAEHTTLNL